MDKQHELIRRSTLILPVNNKKFVDKSWQRNADAIMLDLEDSIPYSEKANARKCVKEAIKTAGLGGSDVLVRLNSEQEEYIEDLKASIYEGLTGIVATKVEHAHQIIDIEERISDLEQERGLPAHSLDVGLLIETAQGFLNMQDIVKASKRAVTVALGTEDFALDLGIEPSTEGDEIQAAKAQTLIIAVANGLIPTGLIGSFADFKDLEGLKKNAQKAVQFGSKGASCIHPDQVTILNQVFSPTSSEVEYAYAVIDAYEEAEKQGSAATALNGKMIDIPVVKRAYKTVARHENIARIEARKKACLDKIEK